MRLRSVDPTADRPLIAALIGAVAASGDRAPLSEEAERDLSRGSGRPGLISVKGDRATAYVHVRDHGDGTTIEPVLAPDLTADAVAGLIDDVVGAIGDRPMRIWTANEAAAGVVRRLGFREDRRVVCLERPLPPDDRPAYPTGVRPAAFRPGVDEGALLIVHNEAFAGHPDLGGWDDEALAWRFDLPWFDRRGLFVAWDRGRPIGVCWTKASPPGVGEVYIIAVRPDAESRGIGRAMTITGLRYLAGRGASTARIFTDANNDRGARLYRGLGFGPVGVRRRLVCS